MRQNERGTRKQMNLAAESVGKYLQTSDVSIEDVSNDVLPIVEFCAIVERIDMRVTMHYQFTALQLLR